MISILNLHFQRGLGASVTIITFHEMTNKVPQHLGFVALDGPIVALPVPHTKDGLLDQLIAITRHKDFHLKIWGKS